ncbi:predicted protein [Enterococcus casseliflavus EC30]|nr:predicted protein [Enterococcus casseliflavus EC30]EEV37375.1 predicted protein [Enterococcus casseliflavus EC10]
MINKTNQTKCGKLFRVTENEWNFHSFEKGRKRGISCTNLTYGILTEHFTTATQSC